MTLRGSINQLVFGPIASRRLGLSLGINPLPCKTCSFSCVYCQLGRTPVTERQRRAFLQPERVVQAVRERLAELAEQGQRVDYLTFVPDGEPTLDAGLGRMIELLQPVGIPIAVITNGSLCWRAEVREELSHADWVSLKVDAGRSATWRACDRPDPSLSFAGHSDGLKSFARTFAGVLVTETMLVAGVNDSEQEVEATAELVAQIAPRVAYLAVPTRPPAEPWAQPPADAVIARAYALMAERLPRVECLLGYPEPEIGFAHDLESELAASAGLHPLRRAEVERMLVKAHAHWTDVERMIEHGELARTEYRGQEFYLRPRSQRLRGETGLRAPTPY